MKEKKEKEIKKADSSYDHTSFEIEGKPCIDGQYINVCEFVQYLPLLLRGFLVFEKVTGFFFYNVYNGNTFAHVPGKHYFHNNCKNPFVRTKLNSS